jgi:hypothetical protein
MDRVTRYATLTLALAACGRIDFDDRTDSSVAIDVLAIDGNPACISGDGNCPYGCAGADDDCITTCGDGVCIGNAGELCVNCAADCQTTNPVCGNGACDPGEAAAGCIADCGPAPWPWLAEETDLFAKINATRASGYACPNGPKPATGQMAMGVFEADAREWSWELAHQKFFMTGGTVCNGRTFMQRSNNFTTYAGFLNASGPSYPTVDAALALWLSNPGECDALLEPLVTNAAVAVAHDATNAYVLLVAQ